MGRGELLRRGGRGGRQSDCTAPHAPRRRFAGVPAAAAATLTTGPFGAKASDPTGPSFGAFREPPGARRVLAINVTYSVVEVLGQEHAFLNSIQARPPNRFPVACDVCVKGVAPPELAAAATQPPGARARCAPARR